MSTDKHDIDPFSIFTQSDVKTKDLINGYIRKYQHKLFSHFKNSYYNIPRIVNHICVAYIYEPERWDENCKPDHFITSDNTIRNTKDEQGSAFLTMRINKGINRWKLQCNHVPHSYSWHVIGIWKTRFINPPTNKLFLTSHKNGYGYVLSGGYLSNPERAGCSGINYGIKCKDNDIIEMIVNFESLTISFKINDEDFGTAFKIENTEYRAAVRLPTTGSQLTLLSYNSI